MVLVVMLVYILFKVAQHFHKDMEGYFKEKVGQVFICDLIFFQNVLTSLKKKKLKKITSLLYFYFACLHTKYFHILYCI